VAHLGRHDAAAGAAQQLLPELLFEPAYLDTDRGRRQTQLGAGRGDAACSDDTPEIQEVVIVEPLHGCHDTSYFYYQHDQTFYWFENPADRRKKTPSECGVTEAACVASRVAGAEKWRRPLKDMRILAVLDGSRWAETVLPKAVELVRNHPGAKVVVIRAVDPATLPGDGGNEARASAINEAAEYLDEVATRLRSEGVRPVGRSVWYAPAGPAIVQLARTVKLDVILMAAERREETGRLERGPIAEFVRDRTPVPVVLVAGADSTVDASARGGRGAGKEMMYA